MEKGNKNWLLNYVDQLRQQASRLARGESFDDLSARYHESLRQWEDAYVAKVLRQEWEAGNLTLNTNARREGDGVPSTQISPDEEMEAIQRGIIVDDVFLARGQHSFDKLWAAQEPSPTNAPERNAPHLDGPIDNLEAHFDVIVKEVMQTFENIRLELILEGTFSRHPDHVLDLERYRQNFNSPIYEMNFHVEQFSFFWDRVTQLREQTRTERQRADDGQPTERGIDR